MPALLVDLSHHQDPAPTPAQLKSAGVAGVILKATEGTGYIDPTFAARRRLYALAGLAVGMYHFTDLADVVAEADHFAAVIGALRPGEFVGLDLERSAAGVDVVAYSGAWLDRLAAHVTGEVRLEYLNKAELAAHDWSPIAARGVRLWLADYDGQQSLAGVPAGAFRVVTLKQYSDRGAVAGFSLDVDWLPGQLPDLTGAGSPVPPPTPAQETDMPLTARDETAIAASGGLIEAIAQRERQILIDGSQPWSLTHISGLLGMVLARLSDPKAFAAELAAQLGGKVSEPDLETALRSVLGSLDNAPATSQ